MKKLLTLFAFAVTMLSFAACSSDDDDPSIVGTWKEIAEIEYVSTSDERGKEYLPEDDESTIMTFNSNGTYTKVYTYWGGSETHSGTYTLKGGKIYMDDDTAAEYSFSGDNTLFVTVYDEDGRKVLYWSRQ